MKKLIFIGSAVLLFFMGCQSEEQDEQTQNALQTKDKLLESNLKVEASSVESSSTDRKLLASDDFNGGTIDDTKWYKSIRNNLDIGDNMDDQITEWDRTAGCVWQKDGILYLTSKKTSTGRIESGCLLSNGKSPFQRMYGYIEVRMKICNPKDTGVQSAFWLMGPGMTKGENDTSEERAKGGSKGAEIDVFESSFVGDRVQSTLHINSYETLWAEHNSNLWTAAGSSKDEYHTYGLEWTSTQLKFYYDDKLQWTRGNVVSPLKYWVPKDVSQYVLLSTGPAWGDAAEGFGTRKVGSVTYTMVEWVKWWDKRI